MTRLAFTGHRGLPDDVERLIDDALRTELERFDATELVGYSSLADGADTLFAQAILDLGGRLVAIIPAADYRHVLPAAHRPVLDDLIAQAVEVVTIDFPESTSESHMAAARWFLDHTEELVAVWDGQPARGYGGTGDIVALARDRQIPVSVIWPDGAHRD
jgi:hypothetical protein